MVWTLGSGPRREGAGLLSRRPAESKSKGGSAGANLEEDKEILERRNKWGSAKRG